MSNNALVSPANTHLLEWAGLLLTPGLGPVRARKLVEHFGSAEAVFAASLTLLEETGIQAVSAQSIAYWSYSGERHTMLHWLRQTHAAMKPYACGGTSGDAP